ncbi:MAG: undecaprenyldiphospho-muramoylpentapeptide beta-N-acetylglucosaminyltransferase [Gammaproteobacteria bacterium]|nr:undecaprenyldiphospho-muramoylpentapeptide beta-N-acetylglucosaminyltransferase [Gammaproteobacteria bacterium]
MSADARRSQPAAARVALLAGGTGGHVFPGLAVAECLRDKGLDVVWFGTRTGLENRVAPAAGFVFETVRVGGVRGKKLLQRLAAPWVLSLAFWRMLAAFVRRRPALVLGMGGFVSAPGGVAAFVLGVPLVIHEQNAAPGLANRCLAPLSDRVLTGFPGVLEKRGATFVGNPLRRAVAARTARGAARARGGELRLLVLGGSLGASVFNRVVPRALALMERALRPRTRQQTGRGHLREAAECAGSCGVEIEFFEFEDDVGALYEWGDLVLCRAGAMTVAEIAAAGVAAILVPYPHAVDDHQTHNARYLSERGAAVLIPQRDLSAQALADELARLHRDPAALERMSRAAAALAAPNAGERVAEICVEEMKR